MFASLDFSDYSIIAVALAIFAGSFAAGVFFKPADGGRFRRLERKLDLILTHLGLEYTEFDTSGGMSAEVRALADSPATKIAAIARYREQTGAGLAEAKEAVEKYMERRQK